jgi:hypothetical protein
VFAQQMPRYDILLLYFAPRLRKEDKKDGDAFQQLCIKIPNISVIYPFPILVSIRRHHDQALYHENVINAGFRANGSSK